MEQSAAAVGRLHRHARRTAELRFVQPLDAHQPSDQRGFLTRLGTDHLRGQPGTAADVADRMRGQRTQRVVATAMLDDLHARVSLGMLLDLVGHGRRHVVDQSMKGRLLHDDDGRRRQRFGRGEQAGQGTGEVRLLPGHFNRRAFLEAQCAAVG